MNGKESPAIPIGFVVRDDPWCAAGCDRRSCEREQKRRSLRRLAEQVPSLSRVVERERRGDGGARRQPSGCGARTAAHRSALYRSSSWLGGRYEFGRACAREARRLRRDDRDRRLLEPSAGYVRRDDRRNGAARPHRLGGTCRTCTPRALPSTSSCSGRLRTTGLPATPPAPRSSTTTVSGSSDRPGSPASWPRHTFCSSGSKPPSIPSAGAGKAGAQLARPRTLTYDSTMICGTIPCDFTPRGKLPVMRLGSQAQMAFERIVVAVRRLPTRRDSCDEGT